MIICFASSSCILCCFYMSAGICRGGKNLDALELELEVVLSYPRRVLGTELRSSARALYQPFGSYFRHSCNILRSIVHGSSLQIKK